MSPMFSMIAVSPDVLEKIEARELHSNRNLQIAMKLRIMARTFYYALTSDPVIILNYHRVHAPTTDANNLTVSIAHFREQMCFLKENCEVITLDQAREAKPEFFEKKWGRKKRVAITFDDGYADTLNNALPILNDLKLPASVYVTSTAIDRGSEFWWDEVEELVLNLLTQHQLSELTEVPRELIFDGNYFRDRGDIYRAVCNLLKHSSLEKVHLIMNEMRKKAKVPEGVRDTHRPMTMSELKTIAQNPLIELGAHTIHHLCLGDLSYEEQLNEIRESKKYLEQVLGYNVRSLAYPYGDFGDFNKDSFKACEAADIKMALTTVPGVYVGKGNRYAVPRMFVKNWNGKSFKQKLTQFFWTARA